MEKKEVNLKNLKFGPMLREELSPVLEKWANSIHKSLGDELIGPYEQFEFNFCFDANPMKELFVWQTIASTLELWIADQSDVVSKEKRKEIFKYLLSVSMGAEKSDTEEKKTLKTLMSNMQKVVLEKLKPS